MELRSGTKTKLKIIEWGGRRETTKSESKQRMAGSGKSEPNLSKVLKKQLKSESKTKKTTTPQKKSKKKKPIVESESEEEEENLSSEEEPDNSEGEDSQESERNAKVTPFTISKTTKKVSEAKKGEPAWAKNRDEKELRQVCRFLKIPGYTGFSREKMIQVCDFQKSGQNMKKEELLASVKSQIPDHLPAAERVALEKGILELDIDELVDRVLSRRLVKYYTMLDEANKRLCKTCTDPKSKCPDIRNDTFNDCPPFYRRAKGGKQDGCCVPSKKSKLKAVLRLPLAANVMYKKFLSIMEVQKTTELLKELEKTNMTDEEKKFVSTSYKTGTQELKQWYDSEKMSTRDAAFVLNITKAIQKSFQSNFEDLMKMMKQQQKESDTEMKTIIPKNNSTLTTMWQSIVRPLRKL